MGSLHVDPSFRGLPRDLQARLEVALTLGAQVAAIRKLTDDLQHVLGVQAPQFTAFGVALDHHVRLLETYFAAADQEAYGAGWHRG